MEENYKIYMHKNKINDKVYVGQTKQSLMRRWRHNGVGYIESPLFWNAIQKYGWDNFEHIVLVDQIKTKEKADILERYYISLYQSNDRQYGYNILDGGEDTMHKTVPVYQYALDGAFICAYPSIIDAAKIFNGSLDAKVVHIRQCLTGKRKTYKGFMWSVLYFDKIKPFEKTKKVYQYTAEIDLIQVFDSAKEASMKTGLAQSSIQNVCGGYAKHAGGYIFSYCPLTKEDKINYIKNNWKMVYQYTTELELVGTFESLNDAAMKTGINKYAISKCCTGASKTSGGFIFSYIPLHEENIYA